MSDEKHATCPTCGGVTLPPRANEARPSVVELYVKLPPTKRKPKPTPPKAED